MSAFFDRVYSICRQIPEGKVLTYGALASLAGSPRAARAVGMCMKSNPDAPRTPCHRVVAHDGSLTGYSAGAGLQTKLAMLKAEGVAFRHAKVDLQKSLWRPESVLT